MLNYYCYHIWKTVKRREFETALAKLKDIIYILKITTHKYTWTFKIFNIIYLFLIETFAFSNQLVIQFLMFHFDILLLKIGY